MANKSHQAGIGLHHTHSEQHKQFRVSGHLPGEDEKGHKPVDMFEHMLMEHDFDADLRAAAEAHEDKFVGVRTLPVIRKLNKGRFEDITIPEFHELFKVIDTNNNGKLEFDEVKSLLKGVMIPPCTDAEVNLLYQFTDQDESGTVSADELHGAFTAGPLKQHLKTLQHEYKIKQKAAHSMGRNAPVDRELLHDQVSWRVNQDDSFATLPFSMVTIVIFIAIVITHLHISARARASRGMEAWITGYGAELVGPFVNEHVGDRVMYWDWLDRSGLPAIFGDCSVRRNDTGLTCRMASRSTLLGDAQMFQLKQDDSEELHWLLNGAKSQEHLASHPEDILGAARAEMYHLRDSGWASDETKNLELRFSTYCETSGIFAANNVQLVFEDSGLIVPLVISHAYVASPYSSPFVVILDFIYAVLLLWPLYSEMKELIAAIRLNGIVEGFTDYLGVWNIVDLLSIGMGVFNCILWMRAVLAMQENTIQDMLTDSGHLKPDVLLNIGTEQIVIIEDALAKIRKNLFLLHLVMGMNVVTILLKFGKAFQANPRLQLVTATLVRASTDIVHWMIVFLAIFAAYSTIGHVYFGQDFEQFSSFARSVNTAFIVLMGEFNWYIDATTSALPLASGMPTQILKIWFWTYNIFVLLILLNMLLAIVLDHYTEIGEEIKQQGDVKAVWTQARRFIRRTRETKGFVPLFDVLMQLDDNAHPEKRVTAKSLVRAFDGMRSDQAEWIMEWLTAEASARMRQGEDQENIALLKEIEGLIESMSDEQKIIGLSVHTANQKVVNLQKALKPDLRSSTGAVRFSQEYRSEDGGSGVGTPMSPTSPTSPANVFLSEASYSSQVSPQNAAGAGRAARSRPIKEEPFRPTEPQVHPAEQLRSQALMIREMAQKVTELNERMDKIVPQTSLHPPLPSALGDLTRDIAGIKKKLEGLVGGASRSNGYRNGNGYSNGHGAFSAGNGNGQYSNDSGSSERSQDQESRPFTKSNWASRGADRYKGITPRSDAG